MENAKRIAGLVGPTMVALAMSEAMNFHIFANQIAPVVYLNGTILFVAGLSLVRSHNRWSRDWPVLVTLTGWVVLLAGLYRMFAPEAPQAAASVATYAMLAVLFAIGSFLTLKAYGQKS